jgi:glycine cleavage system H protein
MNTEIDENFWVKITDEIAVVGITEYAQSMLGEISFVELPEVKKFVKRGDEIGTIESLKAISPLISPLDGEICEVNAVLEKTPEIINENPLGSGWIWKMKVTKK